MEWIGMGIDSRLLESLGQDLKGKLGQVRLRIYDLAGREFTIESVPQLREVLFERLGLPVQKRTKTGPSTDADVLADLAAAGYELPTRLLEYREYAKLKSTYVDGLRALISPETGRLHTSFNQAGTATGRLSSSEPNLQNIPIRTPLGASIRKAFVPANGFLMLVADYSQIDLRVLAHLSKDPAFMEAFRAGRDIHRETAAQIFGVKLSEVTSEMRATAKMVNYATLYGQGASSLARQLGITEQEAQKFIDGYFLRFPSIRSYLDGQIEQAEREGYVETIFSRRRYIPELRSQSPGIRNFGHRVAQNTPFRARPPTSSSWL
jgi:DNA polymerase-1